MIEIYEGKIVNFENYEVENVLEESSQEIIKSFVEQKWIEQAKEKKYTFLLPELLDLDESLAIPQESPQI